MPMIGKNYEIIKIIKQSSCQGMSEAFMVEDSPKGRSIHEVTSCLVFSWHGETAKYPGECLFVI